jgi:protein TonB
MAMIPTNKLTSGVVANSGDGTLGRDSDNAPISEGIADAPAKLVAGAPPAYTAAAQAAGVEADVPLEIVVDSAGSVQSARVLGHAGYGLDEAALGAVRGYRFAPARRAGKAVAVRMRWLMRFQLR